MPRNITITFADGSQHVYQNAPDDVTPEAVQERATKEFGKPVQSLDGGKKSGGYLSDRLGEARDILAGGVRGAGSIGATLLAPVDMARDAMDGKGLSLESNRQRRRDMDASLRDLGADTESNAFALGKMGAEIAGTAGAGGALAAPLRLVAPRAAQAIATGGFTTGGPVGTTLGAKAADLGLRTAGGAINGGLSAGLVNPEDAGKGVAIGAALPGALKAVGATAGFVGRTISKAMTPQDVQLADKLAQVLGMSREDLQAALVQQGPQLIPGYKQTVPQILQRPDVSQMQRTAQTAGGQALADAGATQQAQFREAINRVAPVDLSVQDAAARAGGAIENFARPAERAAGQRVNALFDAVDPAQARMQLPLQQMEAARTRFLGPGSFGKGGAPVDAAIEEAAAIGTRRVPGQPVEFSSSDVSARGIGAAQGPAETMPQSVPFDQIQALRSSIGEAITDATKNGRNQAAAALQQMKNAIDDKVADVAAGNALPGEVFTPEAIDTWGQALAAHAGKKRQFNTGPQAQMFRQGGDGQPALQGAEIPGKFFSGRRSQVEDVESLHRLVGNRSDLIDEMKRYATTEGVSTASASGDLTSKFIKWLQSRSGANRALFNEQELATLQEVGKAVERSMKAENLGRVSNSDTAQKAASMMDLGLLDNKLVDILANRTPVIGQVTGPVLGSLRASATKQRANVMARLLADPEYLNEALQAGAPRNNAMADAMRRALPATYRAAPVISAQ